MEALTKELKEKLPPEEIGVDIQRGIVAYYDYYGVTFRDTEAERRIVEEYIIGVITAKTGFPVEVTGWSDSNNGHFAHRFKRAQT